LSDRPRKVAVYRPADPGQAAWNADVVQALRELQSLPILQGRMISDVEVAASDTLVQHGLGRVPSGFWVVNVTSNNVVWQPAAATKHALHLQAAAPITVDIWVF
jgi:hypothetical protein